MADRYWRYGDSRQQAAAAIQMPVSKRPRSDYDVPSGNELLSYHAREDERVAPRIVRDTDPIGASYDRFLRSSQLSSYSGGESVRSMSSGLGGHPADDLCVAGMGGSDPGINSKSQSMGVGGGRLELPLPPDASSTLFVEGLPANCTRREVAHIFRPFVGYKEVRLVPKESRHPGGEPLILCFVDFVSPAHAATAMDALQGLRPVLRRMILAQQSLLFSSEIICCSSLMLVTRVIVNGRICGDIAVSRAFGDMPLKAKKNEMLKKGLDEGRWSQKFISRIHFTKDLVTACPDVSQVALGSDAEYVILASDGLWDYINRTEGLKITSAFLLQIWDG